MIRYHSFYPSAQFNDLLLSIDSDYTFRWHREGAYMHLANARDEKLLEAVKAFNPYDLYSKCDEPLDPAELRPYYEGLIAKFFPGVIEW